MYKLIIIYSYVVYRRYCLSAWRGTGPTGPAGGRVPVAGRCMWSSDVSVYRMAINCPVPLAARRDVACLSRWPYLLTYLASTLYPLAVLVHFVITFIC